MHTNGPERADYLDIDEDDEVDPNTVQQKVVVEGLISFLQGGL